MAWRKIVSMQKAPSQSHASKRHISKGIWVARPSGWGAFWFPAMKKNVMAKKIFFVALVALFLSSLLIKTTFAISGACSYHGGVNCNAGANAQGYSTCNDGWVSSVPYSQTDECQTLCLTPAEVSSEIQTIQQDANQLVQSIQNEYTAIFSEDNSLQNQCLGVANGEAAAHGMMGSPNASAYSAQCDNSQYKIDSSEESLAIAQDYSNAHEQEQKIQAEQCDSGTARNPMLRNIGELFVVGRELKLLRLQQRLLGLSALLIDRNGVARHRICRRRRARAVWVCGSEGIEGGGSRIHGRGTDEGGSRETAGADGDGRCVRDVPAEGRSANGGDDGRRSKKEDMVGGGPACVIPLVLVLSADTLPTPSYAATAYQ